MQLRTQGSVQSKRVSLRGLKTYLNLQPQPDPSAPELTLSCCSTMQARCLPRSCDAKYAGLTRASFTLRVYLLESIRVGTHRRSLPCPWSATADGARPCSRSAAGLRTSPPFSMFYSARIDKLKAHIRDTGVPLCPNSYEPLFRVTCVNSNKEQAAQRCGCSSLLIKSIDEVHCKRTCAFDLHLNIVYYSSNCKPADCFQLRLRGFGSGVGPLFPSR